MDHVSAYHLELNFDAERNMKGVDLAPTAGMTYFPHPLPSHHFDFETVGGDDPQIVVGSSSEEELRDDDEGVELRDDDGEFKFPR